MAEGIALVGVFIAISMLLRWLVLHDDAPDGRTRGLFAMREPEGAERDVANNPDTQQRSWP